MSHTISVAGLSDIGKARSRNEDSLALLPGLGVAVVADGMGGHPGGDIASRIAAETAVSILGARLAATPENDATPELLSDAMRQSIRGAHEALRQHVVEHPELDGMGTTITALVVQPGSGRYALGHVGDSRAYRLRSGGLTRMTRDDTWVQDRVEAGQISMEQAKRHPYAHLLTQCLGLPDAPVPHVTNGIAADGDVYLLCTDGLVGMVEDEGIQAIVSDHLVDAEAPRDPRSALDALIEAANNSGGYDNITAALVVVDGPTT